MSEEVQTGRIVRRRQADFHHGLPNFDFVEAALREAQGEPTLGIHQVRAVAGGCIHEARRLATSHGEFFVKWGRGCPEDIFLREAECLEALRHASTELVIPRVIAASAPKGSHPAFLILEYLSPADSGAPQDAERLGRGLAGIHRGQAARFGFPVPTYCGATRQDNAFADSWPEFYRERRLRPLVLELDRQGQLSRDDARMYERLMERLQALLPKDSAPSLIHGDLWSGNVLWTTRGPALVDPGSAYCDREMEFGIATLFGGFSARAFSAYEEAWPLPHGWRDRNPLYQIYHLLNHAVLFGGDYGDAARRVATRFAG